MQFEREVLPLRALKVPGTHSVQEVWPVMGLYEPAAHERQADRPEELYVPAAHERQANTDELPVLGLYVPAAHERQAAWPVMGLYVPAAHERQAATDELPVLGVYVRAAHERQAATPVASAPAGHVMAVDAKAAKPEVLSGPAAPGRKAEHDAAVLSG